MSIMSVSSISPTLVPSVTEVATAAAARRTQEALAQRAADAVELAARTAAADDARKAAAESDDVRKTAAADAARQIAMAERTQTVDSTVSSTQALQSRTSTNRVDMYL
jgi:hypothetical protein